MSFEDDTISYHLCSTDIHSSTTGENAIILYPGANHCITQGEINSWLDKWIQSSNDTAIRCILLQNEIGQLSLTHAIQEASARGRDGRSLLHTKNADDEMILTTLVGIPIVFNPAPMTEDIPSLLGTRMPTGVTSYLVNLTLNETEFHTILASADLQSKPALRDPAFWDMMQHGEIHPTTHPNLFESTQGPPGPVETPTPYSLCHRLAGLLGALVGLRTWLKSHGHERCEVILTRGRKGLVYVSPITATLVVMDAWHGPIAVEDTTGAGDTWLGYYAALRMAGGSGSCALEATPLFALAGASVAAAIATTQAGAAQAIPHRDACQACWRDAHVGIPWWSFSPISK